MQMTDFEVHQETLRSIGQVNRVDSEAFPFLGGSQFIVKPLISNEPRNAERFPGLDLPQQILEDQSLLGHVLTPKVPLDPWFTSPDKSPFNRQVNNFDTGGVLTELEAIREILSRGQIEQGRRRALHASRLYPESKRLARLLEDLSYRPAKSVKRTYKSRETEMDWIRKNRSRYLGQWVALDGNEIIASSESLRTLREVLARKELTSIPLIQKIN